MITNETLKAIMSRRSVRAYKSDPVPDDVLAAVVEAGRAAPYVSPDSRHFTVIRDRAVISRLAKDAAAEGMKISDTHRQMFSAPGFDGTYGAPIVIILAGNKSTVQPEAVCAASVQNMLVAARSLGLGSCWVYFPVFAFHGEKANAWLTELRIPGGYEPCAAVLLGYAADESAGENDDRYKNSVVYV